MNLRSASPRPGRALIAAHRPDEASESSDPELGGADGALPEHAARIAATAAVAAALHHRPLVRPIRSDADGVEVISGITTVVATARV
jgi:hypothetical protein